MKRTLLLLRHCESTGQAPEAPLTAKGFADAEVLAASLGGLGVDAIYSSPYARAIQTIEPFAKSSALQIAIEPRLREHHLSLLPLEDWLDHTQRSFDDLDYRAAGGASLRETQTRALAALTDITARAHRLPVIATHGMLLSSVLKYIHPPFGFEDWRALTNPALYRLVFAGGRAKSFTLLRL